LHYTEYVPYLLPTAANGEALDMTKNALSDCYYNMYIFFQKDNLFNYFAQSGMTLVS